MEVPSAEAVAHVIRNARQWARPEMVLTMATRLTDIAPWLADAWETLLIGSGLDEFAGYTVEHPPETLEDVARAYDRWAEASRAAADEEAATSATPPPFPADFREQLMRLEHERENPRIVAAEYAEWDRSSPFVAMGWQNTAGNIAAVFRAVGGYHAAAALARIVRDAMTEPTATSLSDRARWPIARAQDAAVAVLGPAFVAYGSMVCVATRDDRVAIAHVGDARAYRVRGEVCEQLTADHVFGGDPPLGPLLTRAIGPERVEIEVREISRMPGDVLFLCSRDVWLTYGPAELAQFVAKHGRDAPRVIVDGLAANDPQGTAAVVMVR